MDSSELALPLDPLLLLEPEPLEIPEGAPGGGPMLFTALCRSLKALWADERLPELRALDRELIAWEMAPLLPPGGVMPEVARWRALKAF